MNSRGWARHEPTPGTVRRRMLPRRGRRCGLRHGPRMGEPLRGSGFLYFFRGVRCAPPPAIHGKPLRGWRGGAPEQLPAELASPAMGKGRGRPLVAVHSVSGEPAGFFDELNELAAVALRIVALAGHGEAADHVPCQGAAVR